MQDRLKYANSEGKLVGSFQYQSVKTILTYTFQKRCYLMEGKS